MTSEFHFIDGTRESSPTSHGSGIPAARVAVVIPCYRVARHLEQVIKRIGPEVTFIYCVIDGCPDGSDSAALLASRDDPRVRVVNHKHNSGVGAAVFTGYKEAINDGADIIVKLDGDGQMAPEDLPHLIGPILRAEADYVKGNRFFDLGDVRAMPFTRLIGNAGLSFLSKLSSGYWNLFDPTNGFTAIHAKVASHIIRLKISQRYFFESDLLFRLNTLRAVVVDVPLPARYGDEQSNLNVLKTLFQFPFLHLRNFIKRVFYSYFLRDFNVASVNLIFGLALCLFGVSFGLVHWTTGYERNVLASPGTVMLAALPVILGWQAILAFISYDVGNIPNKPLHPFAYDRSNKADLR
jgi:dolichol-phosphate mannosyltransferase